jgi:hypothetical protein
MVDTIHPVDAIANVPAFNGRQLRQVNAIAFAGATAARPLGGRSGVRPGTSATTVTATATTWTCGPLAGVADVETASEAGMVSFALDAVATGSISAASASIARQDLVYVQIDIPVEDGSAAPVVTRKYIAGTVASTDPPLPVSRAFAIARINVPIAGGGAPTVTWIAPSLQAAGVPEAAAALARNAVPRVTSAAERDSLSASTGCLTVLRENGVIDQFLTAGQAAVAGWYSMSVLNFSRGGQQMNPINGAADVGLSAVTVSLDSPKFFQFHFGGTIQANVSLTANLWLNVDGNDLQALTYARQEAGGTPLISVAGGAGLLLQAGSHTIKLRCGASLNGVSVLTNPWWSTLGTPPINGTYI